MRTVFVPIGCYIEYGAKTERRNRGGVGDVGVRRSIDILPEQQYTLNGRKILREAWGNNELIPLYDVEDAPCGIVYNGTPYYFQRNLLGDVVAIYDTSGNMVAKYIYDAWGNCTISSETTNTAVANANPIRYRGYYFDTEIAMYYLQSRYYDPMVGRFINADNAEYVSLLDEVLAANLYTYCGNSCVNNTDPSGCGPFLAFGIQFVTTIGRLTLGLEALWSASNSNFYLFAFIGGAKTFDSKWLTRQENDLISNIKNVIGSVRNFSISNFSLFKKFSIAVSFVAVLGNKRVSFPRDYCGWFTGASFSFCHVTLSGAYSFEGKNKIGSLGIGVTTSKAGAGFCQTMYAQLTGDNWFKNTLSGLKKGIQDQLGIVKAFTCFFL